MRRTTRAILRIFSTLMMLNILLCSVCTSAYATETTATNFSYELSVDGTDTKEVKKGDIITVVLRLKRTDSDEPYTMYAMQDEICYDSTFLELVEEGTVLGQGIASTDIAMADRYRQFYMNYVSMEGGTQWVADCLIGSIQLKVIGESGVTQITSEDYLVSVQDGSGSYPCEANTVTLVLTTDCTVSFQTNGGSSIPDQIVQFGEKIVRPEDPTREGYRFDGWYSDIHLTEQWDFENDTVEGNLSLYAKWAEETAPIIDENPTETGFPWWIILLIVIAAILMLVYWDYHKKKKQSDKPE